MPISLADRKKISRPFDRRFGWGHDNLTAIVTPTRHLAMIDTLSRLWLQVQRNTVVAVLGLTLAASPQGSSASTLELRLHDGGAVVSFEIPAHCSVREGPGTAEAVCHPDGSAEASQSASRVASLFFEVTLESRREAVDASTVSLAQTYAFADFQKELPAFVCGEERVSRIRMENPQRRVEDGRVVYSAVVTCPEVRFMGLGPRRAVVRYFFDGGTRVTTMARALVDDFERVKPLIDTFHASVTLHTERKP